MRLSQPGWSLYLNKKKKGKKKKIKQPNDTFHIITKYKNGNQVTDEKDS